MSDRNCQHTTHRQRRLRTLAGVVVATLVTALSTAVFAVPARAADGNILRTLTAQVPACGVSTGVGFDGNNLVLSCWESSTLWAVSPEDGHLVASYGSTNGGPGLGALAFDRRRQIYWACTYPAETVAQLTLDPATNTYVTSNVFTPAGGCIDGLAYDGTDDTLFTSGDVAGQIFHYSATGQQLSVRNNSGQLGSCGNSGLAVGGQWLFMANDGCSQIYRSQKDTGETPTLFGSYPQRLEDMECDDVTFGSTGKAVIWSKDAYDPTLNAFELNPGDCGFGGQPAGDLSISPGYQQRYVGGTASITVQAGGFLSPIRAEVLDGPNKYLAPSFTCESSCNSPFSNTYLYRGASGGGAGVDTLRLWNDKNNNGTLDAGEPSSYAFVKWNEAINTVAMGDSYSAGEGVDPYDSGTDDDWGGNRNQCHRSAYAYSRETAPVGYPIPLAQAAKAGPPTTFDFIACSGATTYNIETKDHGGVPQYTEGATQVGQGKADASTDLVVLSVGGNDVGFSTLVSVCALKDCNDPNTKEMGKQIKDWGAAQLAALPPKLATTLADVKAAAPNATIVLLGYPHLFPASPAEQGCSKLQQPWGGEMDWFNSSADVLDTTMRTAAAQAGVHYVSQLSAWAGHEICGNGGEWLNGVTAANPFDWFHKTWVGTGSFHPNQTGQVSGYAATLNAYLKRASESTPTTVTGLPQNPPATFARMLTAAPTDGSLGTLYVGSVAGDAGSSCLPENLVTSGSTVRVGGEGYAPGATVTVGFDTAATDVTPAQIVGTLTADAAGAVQGMVVIPSSAQVDTTALLRANGQGGPGRGENELVAHVGIAAACPVSGYTFTGFFDPVNNGPTVNTMHAGRAVPLKFSLGGDQGLDIFSSGSPTSVRLDCATQAPSDEVEQTLTAGGSSLTYDPVTQRYHYVWKTDPMWAGTCRQLALTLKDGSSHTALFSFRK